MNKCKGPKEDYPTIWRDSKEMSMAGVRRTIWDEVGSVDHGRFCWSLKGLGFYSAVRRETIGSWLVVFFISLMTKDVEDFLMCLFDIWTSLVNVCSYLAYFLIWLFSYYSVLEVFFYIYSGYKSFLKYMLCKYFLQVYALPFHSLNLLKRRHFKLWCTVYPFSFFYGLCYWCHI